MTETVLQEAERLINGDRQDTYGGASESFGRIAALWSAYLGHEVSALDVTNLMILLKVSRTKGSFHRDSYVDIGGYAGLGERLHDESQWETVGKANLEDLKLTPKGTGTISIKSVPVPHVATTLTNKEIVKPVVRQWDRLDHVPPGVIVEDIDGDFYRRINGTSKFLTSYREHTHGQHYEWQDVPADTYRYVDGFGPFKEVVDG